MSEAGFTVDYQKGEDYYRGDHPEGFHVSVTYEGNQTMRIAIKKKEEDAESDVNAENGDAKGEAKPADTGNLADGMRPEFKEAMDRKFAERENEDLSDAEYAYFMEVNARIAAKLLDLPPR